MAQENQPNLTQTSPAAPLTREQWLGRIRYRSWHRGCKETDLILGGYCSAHIGELSDEDLVLLERFLDEDDAEIWAWITGKSAPADASYLPLLDRLRAFEVYKYPV